MTLTVYDASVPVFCRALTNLQALLRKGHTQVTERLLDPTTVIAARLHENMFPLSRHVQIATDHAKGATARLAGVEPPRFADDEKTFDELDQRIARTIDYISGIPAGEIEGSSDRPILLKLGKSELEFKGKSYLLTFALPNFFFHVTTAYGILRHRGIDIGKSDYLGELRGS